MVKDSGLLVSHRNSSHMWVITQIPCCEDNWYHIVVVWDSVDLKLYINGTQVQITSAETRTLDDQMVDNFVIGTSNKQIGNLLGQFYIDEMIYTNDVLSGEEVELLFTSYYEGKFRITFVWMSFRVEQACMASVVFETVNPRKSGRGQTLVPANNRSSQALCSGTKSTLWDQRASTSSSNINTNNVAETLDRNHTHKHTHTHTNTHTHTHTSSCDGEGCFKSSDPSKHGHGG